MNRNAIHKGILRVGNRWAPDVSVGGPSNRKRRAGERLGPCATSRVFERHFRAVLGAFGFESLENVRVLVLVLDLLAPLTLANIHPVGPRDITADQIPKRVGEV